MATRTAKEFLLQECANLQGVLEETLRFKYGLEGSKEFFDECHARLTFIKQELDQAAESDHARLRDASGLLTRLSDLVSRIERSSIGEYSWPFVEELKRIATATCTEATAADPNAKPQFHVWSSGGLDAYMIQPELSRPSGSRKRIHTIVLPKTLKNCVLLHSILGHEVGHAMWRCSKHQAALLRIFTRLTANTAFESTAATASWLYSKLAPAPVQGFLSAPALRKHGVVEQNFFSTVASWNAWLEEVLCDFIGLMTFGPSFVAAECHLLYAMDPAGTGIGQRHPPVGCRANYLLAAAHLRGYDSGQFADTRLQTDITSFWSALAQRRQSDAWFDVLPNSQVKSAVDEMADLLADLKPALYLSPSEDDVGLLVKQLSNAVPPVGFQVDTNQSMCWRRVDFRHVLYAGWVTAVTKPEIGFANINRLCGHAIMQQRAIDIELGAA